MTRPPPSDSIRTIVESAVPSIRVETISTIPTKRLLRPFKVKLTDGRTLLLNLSSPPSRLLRSEQWLIQSEATVIKWLLKDASKQLGETTHILTEEDAEKLPLKEGLSRRWGRHSALEASTSFKDQLLGYLPTLIKHSSTTIEAGSAFSLFEPTSGDSISSLGKHLTDTERKSINFQKGRLLRRIADFTSPNGRFGLAVTVLGPPRASQDTQGEASESKFDFDGTDSWRKTFHSLLEGILRDGEDLAVTISYELVRKTFYKFGHLLDAITTPRLVVCDADDDDIVLVSRSVEAADGKTGKARKGSVEAKIESVDSSIDETRHKQDELTKDEETIRVTGLRDWSNCIFGDPLFATAFSHTNPEFERGFKQTFDAHVKHENDGSDEQQENTDIIEDPDNASTRILLYECYHATVSIVRQFYRPDADSSEREIAARRRLVAALAKLDHVDVAGSAEKRPRRLSRDEWPVKKPRGDTPAVKQEPGESA
ncbi:hypothetical protein F5Y19DRAFT_465764 [Xylariaceae sp. FL1651]|nr:hypothetical protein F5Y19DRAFT_465764 [Xylariaceae sp. FL1651]